jgi:hypothetical protein
MKHQDGRCATNAETIYVQETTICPGAAATADGTSAKPYCSMDSVIAAIDATRNLIVVRGAVAGATGAFSVGSRQLSIVGQSNAAIAGATHPALDLAAGDLYVRNLKLSASASMGCRAVTGSTLRLEHDLATGSSSGGILLDGAAFDIENTTVTNNGSGTLGAITWGGILVNNPPAAGPAKLQLLSVQNNTGGGIACSTALTMPDGVLASGNTTMGQDIVSTCGFSSCGTASATCGAQP